MRTLITFAVILSVCIVTVLLIVRLIDWGMSEPQPDDGVVVITPIEGENSITPTTDTASPADSELHQGQENKHVISRGPLGDSAAVTGRQFPTTSAPAK